MSVIHQGWPSDKNQTPLSIRQYWIHREDLVTANGLVFKGTRLVIPQSIRNELTQRAHASHLGIVYTTNTAREIMYWPGMDADLEEEVRKCESC